VAFNRHVPNREAQVAKCRKQEGVHLPTLGEPEANLLI
jgi:hypothetical protein